MQIVSGRIGPSSHRRRIAEGRKWRAWRDEALRGRMSDDRQDLKTELLVRVREEEALLETIAASTLDGMWFWDLNDLSRIWLSPRMRALFAIAPETSFSGREWWAGLIGAEDHDRARGVIDRKIEDSHAPFDEIWKCHRQDGTSIWVRWRSIVLSNEAGRPTRMLGGVSDVTGLREAEQRLRRSHEIHRAILDATDDGIVRLVVIRSETGGAVDFSIEEANPSAVAMLGKSRDVLIGGRVSEIFRSITRTEAFANLCTAVAENRRLSFEMRYRAEGLDGLYRVNVYPTSDEDDVVVTLKDIGELRRANVKLHEQEALLREVLETVPDAVAAYDEDDRLVLFNEAYVRYYTRSRHAIVLGATYEEIVRAGIANGQYPEAGVSPADQEAWIQDRLGKHRDPGRSQVLRLPDGRWLQVRERRSPTGHIVGVRSDVTKIKSVEAQLKHHAERDVLTELPNRKVFFEHLDGIAEAAAAEDATGAAACALILFDMDHFKDINDTLGHDVGDAVLKEIAQRLVAHSSGLSMVARLGGDEFAATMRACAKDSDCTAIIEDVQEALSRPMVVAGRMLLPRFSIGVAMIPRDGADAATLFKNADIALYEAKRRGRGRWSFFDPVIREQLDRRAAIIERLRSAVGADELSIALQPQADVATGRHVGFEALVRWGEGEGTILPREFVPIAEETGLIVQVGAAVMQKALGFARRALDAGLDPGTISVNVSAGQLKSESFVESVAKFLDRHRIAPARLGLEMTEIVLLDRASSRIEAALRDLHTLGVHIALDDFGTGHASLTNVKRFPVDRIKIDASFVRDIGLDPDDAVIVRAIINLAHSLGKKAVAEGVETAGQLEFLRLNRCDLAQGFHIARPLDGAAAHRYLERIAGTPKAALAAAEPGGVGLGLSGPT